MPYNRKTQKSIIRQPVAAGSFYPGKKPELIEMIDGFFKEIDDFKNDKKVRALIVPHASYIFSGIVAASVYKLLQKEYVHRVVLLGPSHHVGINFAGLTTYKVWETPLGEIPIDVDFNMKLSDNRHFKPIEVAHAQEHSLEVQLPFLQTVLDDFKLVPIVLGQEINYKKIAKKISGLIDSRTLVIASSDLSHYFPQEQANFLDKQTISLILNQKSKEIENEADACGLEAILVLNEIALMAKWKAELIDYKTSGDSSLDLTSVVGYAGIIYY